MQSYKYHLTSENFEPHQLSLVHSVHHFISTVTATVKVLQPNPGNTVTVSFSRCPEAERTVL